MNTKTRCFTRLASAALACTLAMCATPIWAGTIAQMPLFVSLSGVTPNVMFILDDSGSMMFEIMPEDYKYIYSACTSSDNAIYLFPRASGVYGSSDYCNLVINVPSGTNTNPFGAIMRSPQWNKVYYNPAITYTPWKYYDGSDYPNAPKNCAPHNPYDTTKGCRDVTANLANVGTTYWASCNLGTTSCTSGKSTTTTAPSGFTAATYYYYNTSATGTNPQWQLSNYTKVSITSGTYTGHGRENRTDTGCSGSSCTYAAEIQNFANWYTYYRSRVLSARAGIGKAFSTQTTGMRVGFGTINAASSPIDGPTNMSVIVNGVRDFKEDDPATAADETINRKNFFTTLYGRAIPAQGTPLRQALDWAGKYYKRTDTRSPWVDDPSKTTGSFATYSCRKSYTILMTDGYWNGTGSYTAGAASNVDNAAGSLIMPYDPTPSDPSDDIASYKYAPVSPFKDGYSGTLADVAMYYWYQDLQPSLIGIRIPL